MSVRTPYHIGEGQDRRLLTDDGVDAYTWTHVQTDMVVRGGQNYTEGTLWSVQHQRDLGCGILSPLSPVAEGDAQCGFTSMEMWDVVRCQERGPGMRFVPLFREPWRRNLEPTESRVGDMIGRLSIDTPWPSTSPESSAISTYAASKSSAAKSRNPGERAKQRKVWVVKLNAAAN
jgi:hypothetical protein